VNTFKGKATGAVAVSAALLVPLAVFGAPALARSGAAASQYGHGSGSAQYQYRVTICHVTGSKKHPAHTITVSAAAVCAHLRHGDHLGACTGAETRKAHHHGKPAKTHPVKGNAQGNEASSGSTTNPGHGNDNGKGHHGK
jgi:hypothetical protein